MKKNEWNPLMISKYVISCFLYLMFVSCSFLHAAKVAPIDAMQNSAVKKNRCGIDKIINRNFSVSAQQMISDCRTKNLSTRTLYGADLSLLAVTKTGAEFWFDETEKVIWSPILDQKMSYDQADAVCCNFEKRYPFVAKFGIHWGLPLVSLWQKLYVTHQNIPGLPTKELQSFWTANFKMLSIDGKWPIYFNKKDGVWGSVQHDDEGTSPFDSDVAENIKYNVRCVGQELL